MIIFFLFNICGYRVFNMCVGLFLLLMWVTGFLVSMVSYVLFSLGFWVIWLICVLCLLYGSVIDIWLIFVLCLCYMV